MLINSLLEHAICGVRFQPIYSLQEKKIKAWEMLSFLRQGIDCETFFEKMSLNAIFRLLRWQLRITSLCAESEVYFINVPAKLLCRSALIDEVLPSLHSGIVIEVQDPCNFIALTKEEQEVFCLTRQKIKSTGAQIWLDDIKSEHLSLLGERICLFDGVKVDKMSLWENRGSLWVLKSMIAYCSLMVEQVLIEGIEDNELLALAQGTGCNLMQGFLWPEKRLNIDYTSV
ncbi:EAL domain-containing protein [Enterobacter quasimori]|uniref:EAL domain-containing protein n=1 Tax=Enterobacter quasimori TaxID=2838947 RepID=UPI001C0BE03B|nr:EAL domain-containing protein [Enterobacter quasimori]MBT1726997.1 EAL domain-containing protein [Enterobacter quasimori]